MLRQVKGLMTEKQQLNTVAGVRFTKVGKLYHFDYSDYPDLLAGDYVIVETARGRQMGQVMGFVEPEADDARTYVPIMRLATPRDLTLRQHWEMQQDEALATCADLADKVGGYEDVKFVSAQYNYDGSRLTFMFTASHAGMIGQRLAAFGPVARQHIENTGR
jgi:cell fate regulator YaaT (PSP1 superfamily)